MADNYRLWRSISDLYGNFSYGKEDARRSLELGFVPGVLPPGMTESDYLTLDTPQKKEVESFGSGESSPALRSYSQLAAKLGMESRHG